MKSRESINDKINKEESVLLFKMLRYISNALIRCYVTLNRHLPYAESNGHLAEEDISEVSADIKAFIQKAYDVRQKILSIHNEGRTSPSPPQTQGQNSEEIKMEAVYILLSIASDIYFMDDGATRPTTHTIKYYCDCRMGCQCLLNFLKQQTSVHLSPRELLMCIALRFDITNNKMLAIAIGVKNDGTLRTAKCRLRKKLSAISSDDEDFQILMKNILASRRGRKEKK